MAILTIDFEASCLPRHGRSYPIEVGIADRNGRSRAWLIRPHHSWKDWGWTKEAESLHGISYEVLLRDGQLVDVVAQELCQAVRGHRLIADSSLDRYWLETLVSAANIVPPTSIEHISGVLDELGATNEDILSAQGDLSRRGFRRHRAGDDARWLSGLIEILTDAAITRELRGAPFPMQGSSDNCYNGSPAQYAVSA